MARQFTTPIVLPADPSSALHASTKQYVDNSRASEGANAVGFLSRLTADLGDVSWLVIGDSTGNETTEWVHLTAQTLATRFPTYSVVYRLWDAAGGTAYGSPTTIQTGSGTNTLYVWNCSVSGSQATYVRGSRWPAAVLATNPDYICVSHGHNEGTTAGGATAEFWRAQMAVLTESLTEAFPLAALAIVLQNPRGDGVPDQQKRARVYRELAATRGYGLIDAQSVFLALPSLTGYVSGDNVHPTTAGSQLWADEAARVLTFDPKARPREQSPSLFTTSSRNLLVNGDFDQFTSPPTLPNWTATNCSPAKDTRAGWVETPNGWSVRLQASSAAQTYIHQDIPAGLLDTVKGRYVTLLARMKVPTGQATTAGRVQLSDSGGNITSTGSADLRDGFHWIAVTRLVDANATYVRARVYVDSGTSSTADISIASVHLVLGQVPRTGDRPDVLTKADVGLANVDNTSDASKPVSTATQTALDAKVPTTRQIAAGNGLTGGGDLTADRTLTVAYGSTTGTAVQGDDARVTADQAAGTASIRTLGAGALQAAAGDHAHAGVHVLPAPRVDGGDDATVINAFVAATPVGAVITAPAGAVYSCATTVVLQPYRRYVFGASWPDSTGDPPGANRNGVIFRQKAGANLDYVVASAAVVGTGTSPVPDGSLQIDGLVIDGNRANQTGGRGVGLALATQLGVYRDITIYSARGHGIHLPKTNAGGNTFSVGVENHFGGTIKITGCGGHGFWAQDTWTDGTIGGLFVVSICGLSGIKVDNAAGWNIQGAHIWAVGTDGILTLAGYAAHIDNCYVEGFGAAHSSGGAGVPSTYSTYAAGTTYGMYALVVSGGGLYYSLQDGNVGNTPASSPTWWAAVNPGNSAVYGIGCFAIGYPRPLHVLGNTVSIGHVGWATIAGILYRGYIVQSATAGTCSVHVRGNVACNETANGQAATAMAFRTAVQGGGALTVAGMAVAGAGVQTNTKVGTWSQADSMDAGVTNWSPLPDATTAIKGVVQLAGDLGGTAAAPTVPGLAGKASTSHTHAATDVTSGTLDVARVPTGTSGSTVALGNHTHTPAVVPFAPVALTDAATIAIDASLGTHFRVVLGGNRTLGAPSNLTDGQKILVEVKQDGTGSRTLAYNAIYRFGTDVTSPTLTTTAGKTDFLGFVYNSTAAKLDCIAVAKGY